MDRTLAGFAAAVLALCGAGSLLAHRSLHKPAEPPPAAVTRLVTGQALTVPGRWLVPTGEGRPDLLQLSVPRADLDGRATEASTAPVALTVMAADASLDPAERPSLLYARFLEPHVEQTPSGLIRRTFRSGTPYEGEALYIAPPDGRSFAARCAAQGAQPCLSIVRLGPVEVQARFDAAALEDWRALQRLVRSLAPASP